MEPNIETPGHTVARVQALDLLRLIAVFGVVLFHYGFRGPFAQGGVLTALPDLSAFARYGFLGVPVFFIISGFVIAYSADGRSASEFAIARVARIYPTFLLCMTLTCIAVLLFGAPDFQTSGARWLANLAVAAPLLRQPYMDSAYWSLVVEIMFYAWVAALMATRLFPRRIDAIVLAWLAISLVNELTIDARPVEWILLTDHNGFFATGLLIYEFHRGRRDAVLWSLLAAAAGTAIFQAVHNLAWLRQNSGSAFDDWIVAIICLILILTIMLATRIRRLPMPASVVLAIGGMTYPFYLLHQQMGYTILTSLGPTAAPAVAVPLIVLAIALLSLALWRYFETRAQRWTRRALSDAAKRVGEALRDYRRNRGVVSAE